MDPASSSILSPPMARIGESFSSRWGLMAAMLGMAVGTGNIWRFPRIAATNGGGTFLAAWVVMLLAWSVPLIVAEFAMGKRTRRGVIGSFVHFMGERFAWMGAWAACVAAGITFYYAVVMGWTIRYFVMALLGQLKGADSEAVWRGFAFSPAVLPYHFIAVALAVVVVAFGVRGIERAARVLMPTLVLLVVVLAVRAVTLPGASRGLQFLFEPDWAGLANYRVWIEALTQNAWDTGAGWGLVLTYAIYSRRREDTNLNAFLLAFGNNSISLLAGIAVLCTVFSLMPDAATQIVGAGNEGLTFVWIPRLFSEIPGGGFFRALFFLALIFAAWTSIVATFEVVARVFVERGIRRRTVVIAYGIVAWIAGIPAALSQRWFLNQDFVWSTALMISGLCFVAAIWRYGVARFRSDLVNTAAQDMRVGRWWEWAIRIAAVEAVGLVAWWLWGVRDEPLLGAYGLGNLAIQWALVLAVLVGFNSWFVRRTGEPLPHA